MIALKKLEPFVTIMELQTDYRNKLGQMRTLFRRRGGCQEAPILLAEI